MAAKANNQDRIEFRVDRALAYGLSQRHHIRDRQVRVKLGNDFLDRDCQRVHVMGARTTIVADAVSISVDRPIQRGHGRLAKFHRTSPTTPITVHTPPPSITLRCLPMGSSPGKYCSAAPAADQHNVSALHSLILVEGASFEDGKPDRRKIAGIRAAQHEVQSLALRQRRMLHDAHQIVAVPAFARRRAHQAGGGDPRQSANPCDELLEECNPLFRLACNEHPASPRAG